MDEMMHVLFSIAGMPVTAYALGVVITLAMRTAVMAVIFGVVSAILFAIIPYEKPLMLALMLQYTLPAPFIIPLFADLGEDGEYVSTALSMGTLVSVFLFVFVAAFSLM